MLVIVLSICIVASIAFAAHTLSPPASSSPAGSSGSAAAPTITIVRKTDPQINVIFTIPVAVEDAFIARLSDTDEILERINMTKTPSIGLSTTYTFKTNRGLANGAYHFIIRIRTLSGNRQVYDEPFTIDTPQTEITILEPRLGISNDLDYSFTILTMREGERVPSRCKYAVFKAASFDSPGLKAFDYPRDGGASETHTITSFREKFTIEPNKPEAFLYFYCIDDLGIEVQKTVQPVIDTISPRITSVQLDPALWGEYPVSGPFFTTISAQTSEKSICKYIIRNAGDYVAEIRYDSMAPFPGFDRFNADVFNITNKVWVELPNRDQVSYNISVQCEDMAGLFTKPQSVIATVNLTSPLGILVTSPPRVTSNSDITFEFTTKKRSYCSYVASDGTEQVITEASNPVKDHSFDYGHIDDGDYTFRLRCQSGSAGSQQSEELTYLFTVDTQPPSMPNITATTFATCQNTSFPESMNIRFSAQDARTGVASYTYRIPGIINTPVQSSGQLPAISQNENGTALNLSSGRVYKLQVTATDRAGLTSATAEKDLLYDKTAWQCLEHDPPTIDIDEEQQLGTVLASMSCDDDSGCNNRSFKYGLAGSERNCTATLVYDDPVLVSRPSYICFYAEDTLGNNATKSTQVVVTQASSCANGIADSGEADVDCGGSCGGTCNQGKKCKKDSDCKTDYCSSAGICEAASCTDKIKNQHETDVDCGGECGICQTGKTCKIDTDCSSGLCDPGGKICVESTCSDTIKGPGEADIDCGGACTAKCGIGKKCKLNSDCTTLYCSTFYGECRASPANETPTPPGLPPADDNKGMMMWVIVGVLLLVLLVGGLLWYHAKYGKKTLKSGSAQSGRLLPPQHASQSSLSKKEAATSPAILRATRYHDELIRKKQEKLLQQRMMQRHGIFKAFDVSALTGAKAAENVQPLPKSVPKIIQKQGEKPGEAKKLSEKQLPLHHQLFERLKGELKGEEWIPLELLHQKHVQHSQHLQTKQAAQGAGQQKQKKEKESEERDENFDRLDTLSRRDEFFDELENMKGTLNKALGGVFGDIGKIAEGKERGKGQAPKRR